MIDRPHKVSADIFDMKTHQVKLGFKRQATSPARLDSSVPVSGEEFNEEEEAESEFQ